MNPLALMRHALSLCLLLLLCLASPTTARAQDDEGSDAAYEKDRGSLNMQVDEKGATRVWLTLAVTPGDPEAVRQRLAEAVGLPLTFESDLEVEYDEEDEAEAGAAGGWWTARAHSEGVFPREGLVSGGRLDIARLAEALRPLGVTQVYVNVSFLGEPKNLRVSGAKKLGMPEELGRLGGREAQISLYSVTVETEAAAPVEFSWGYRPADILWQLTPLFLFLVVPPLLTLRTRWAVARRPQAEPTEVWGRYFRFLNRLIYFGWLAWLPVYTWAALGELLAAVKGDGGGLALQAVGVALYFAPPLFVIWLCHRLSSGIYRRVGGGVEWSPRAVVGRVVALNAMQVAPFFLLLLALDSLGAKSGYAGLLMLGAVVAWLMLSQLAARAYAAVAHEVTRGELRDRVFALAEKAGVQLRQIYVLPDGPAQLSNAFARGDNCVLLTASLLRHLSKREVNAIVAHEIGHLKERHPQAVARLTIGTIFVANLVGWTFASAVGLQRWSPAFFSLSLLAASLVAHYLSRGNERHADSIGVNLTQDPEAFITGLARLSRLNLMPLDGGRWGDALDTHPATLGRLRDIAGFGGITPARFEELLAGARAGAAAGEYYDSTELEPDRAFSAAFKARWTGRVVWSMIAVILLPPALFALLLDRLQPWGGPLWASLPAGLLLSLGLYHLFRNFASFWGYAKMTAQLRMRLAPREQAATPGGQVCVGLAPGGEERSYENYPFWDAGLLRLSGGRLCYAGEQTRFELRREQVKDIYLGDAHPIWLRQKRLHLRWHDEAQGRGGTFQLLPLEERTLLRCRRETALLHGRLRGWLAGVANESAAATAEAPAPPPDLDAVTGQPMSERTGARAYMRSIFMLVWLSFLLSLGVRLTLWGMLYTLAVVVAVCTLDHLPKLWERASRTAAPDTKAGESPGAPQPYQRGSWAES